MHRKLRYGGTRDISDILMHGHVNVTPINSAKCPRAHLCDVSISAKCIGYFGYIECRRYSIYVLYEGREKGKEKGDNISF